MREYDYKSRYGSLLLPDIVSLVARIHEYKGEQMLFIEAKADALTKLVELAKIQSTESSNKLEGIDAPDERFKKLVRDKTMPRTRNEREIAGYRDVLKMIHENHDYIPLKASVLLQLHRDLYRFAGDEGGKFKHSDNVITQEDGLGNSFVRFRPVPAWETPEHIEAICRAYDRALGERDCDALLLIPMLVLDFLCIHPFHDGNGRMSRLLTLLLLYRAGYIVGKYISIERLIEQSKESYYEALRESSEGWHEGTNQYAPFVRYMLGVVIGAYREFSERVQVLAVSGLSKTERVRAVIQGTLGKMTRAQIMEKCPDISRVTVERTLTELVKSGDIIKLGGGRYTFYIWNREEERGW